MIDPVTMERLQGCARCQGDGHDNITFEPLTHPYVEDSGAVMTHLGALPIERRADPLRHGRGVV